MIYAGLGISLVALAASAQTDVESLRSLVVAPLSVDGETIDSDEIKRSLVYAYGAKLLEAHRREALVEIFWGEMRHHASVVQAEALVERERRRFQEHFEGASFESAVFLEFGTLETAERWLCARDRFDALFLPRNPRDWPEVTVEAIRPEADGRVLEDRYESWDENQQEVRRTGGEARTISETYQGYLRDTVERSLLRRCRARTWSQGLPNDLVLRIDGPEGSSRVELTLNEAFEELLPALDPDRIARERRWVASLKAVERQLSRDGLLLPRADAARLYDGIVDGQGDFCVLESVALYTDEFPSLEHFRAYFRTARSYRQLFRSDEVRVEEGRMPVQAARHVERAKQVLGIARLQHRVLRFSARDPRSGRITAAASASALRQAQIVANELSSLLFDSERLAPAVMDEIFDEFQSEPSYRSTPRLFACCSPNSPAKDHAHCHEKDSTTLHDLTTRAGLSYYSELRDGTRIAEDVFFDQQERTLSAPISTPEGFVLIWIDGRTGPKRPLRWDDARHVQLLFEATVEREFGSYWRETVGLAHIEDRSESSPSGR